MEPSSDDDGRRRRDIKRVPSHIVLVRQASDILRRAAESIKANEACSGEAHAAARESEETALKN
jgi:prephenate dehydratase